MERLFYHIYVCVQRHRVWACVVALAFLFGCAFVASKLRFEEDITQIIPKSDKADEMSKVIRQINFADKITVLIQRGDTVASRRLSETATAFADALATDTIYIRQLSGQIGQEEMASAYDFVYQHLSLFLDTADYQNIAEKTTKDSINQHVAQNYKTLLSPTGLVMSGFIQKDPLGLALMGLKKLQKSSVGDNFMLYDGFISTKDTAQMLLFIDPKYQGADTEHNTLLVEKLYSLQDSLNKRFEGQTTLSYYGAAFIAVANAKQIKRDISTTVLISVSVLMLLLIFFYRKIYIPLLVFIPTVFATLFAIACLYLYKPVISAISLSIGAVLIGITIDYALHVLTHFKKSGEVKQLYQELTRPILMSGATNAVVFLCLLFVHSEALIDLGIFASICIFSSAIFTLLIVPHLYRPKKQMQYSSWMDKLASFPFEKSRGLIGLCAVVILISCFTSGRVGYNPNIAGLNFVPEAIKKVEAKLDKLTNTSSKSLYLVSTGRSFEEAAQKADALNQSLENAKSQKEIIDYNGLHYIPLSSRLQAEKIEQWNSFWSSQKREQVAQDLITAGERYGFTEATHGAFYTLLAQPQSTLSLADFSAWTAVGLSDFVAENTNFFTISSLVKLDDAKKASFLRKIERENEVVVIDRQQLNETFLGQLREDFNRLVGYSSFAVLLILWLFFRRIELVLLSAIPIGLTGLVTAGLMGLFGLEFNIFSAIVCTLVFGHGVDFSIFMTAALQKQYTSGKDELQTYRTSILLAVLTTVLAIGALIFAKHPALISISSVTLVGVFAAVIITFVFYPILFRFFITNRAKNGKSPFTITILLFSLLFFAYYGLGCLVISFFGRIVLRLVPISKQKRDAVFRKTMSKFMKSVLYFHPLTRNKTLNPYNESFVRPAVVIANHSSFLDTLSMGMLFPKGIFLVNDWVWNSPVFGRAVRALGFYPVSKGLEDGLKDLRQKVREGYSLIVFPEGTRSYDNRVKRFHKGAFYLAEQLDVDVLPVYLLGNGDVLPKGDILIFKGPLMAIIGKRILANDISYGDTYSDRTKRISQMFRKEHRKWRLELEDADYFREKLLLAYYYKDEDILLAVTKHFDQWKKHFHELHPLLGNKTKIVHVSESYGEMDYLLSLQNGDRRVVGVIADGEKRQVAESIYWKKHRRVTFVERLEHAEGEVLLLSSTEACTDFPQDVLLSFTEIYTFNPEPALVRFGWSEYPLSTNIIKYSR